MPLISFSRSKTNKLVEEINRVIYLHKKEVNKIDNLLVSYQNKSWQLFRGVLARFIRKVYNLPASEEHHHSEDFGLVKHSLETVIIELINQSKKLDYVKYDGDGIIDSQFSIKNKEKFFYRAALTALLHDYGKVFDVEIIADNGEVFDPLEDCLLDFMLRNKKKVNYSWLKKRYKKHEGRSIIALIDILTKRDREYLGPINYLLLVDNFKGYKDTVTELVKEADAKSVEINTNDETVLLTDCFRQTTMELTEKKHFTLNKSGAQLFVTDTFTAMVSPSAIQYVVEHMQKWHEHKTIQQHICNLLRDKQIIISDDTGRDFFHIITKLPGSKKTARLSAILIRNKWLWQNGKPDNFPGELVVEGYTEKPLPISDEEVVEEPEGDQKAEVEKLQRENTGTTDKDTDTGNNKDKDNEYKYPQSREREYHTDTDKDTVPGKPAEERIDILPEQNLSSSAPVQSHDIPFYEQFIKGMVNGILSGKLPVNGRNANIFIYRNSQNIDFIIIIFPAGFNEISSLCGLLNSSLSNEEKRYQRSRIVNSFINTNYVTRKGNQCVFKAVISDRPDAKPISFIPFFAEKIKEFTGFNYENYGYYKGVFKTVEG